MKQTAHAHYWTAARMGGACLSAKGHFSACMLQFYSCTEATWRSMTRSSGETTAVFHVNSRTLFVSSSAQRLEVSTLVRCLSGWWEGLVPKTVVRNSVTWQELTDDAPDRPAVYHQSASFTSRLVTIQYRSI